MNIIFEHVQGTQNSPKSTQCFYFGMYSTHKLHARVMLDPCLYSVPLIGQKDCQLAAYTAKKELIFRFCYLPMNNKGCIIFVYQKDKT